MSTRVQLDAQDRDKYLGLVALSLSAEAAAAAAGFRRAFGPPIVARPSTSRLANSFSRVRITNRQAVNVND
jgi:hypothetical protein